MDEKGFLLGVTRVKGVFKAVVGLKKVTAALQDGNRVFDCETKEKAKRDYRMLILDGHGSHVTPDFINYCDSHRILLTIFPPHATHNLQPLDVVLFSPLAAAYSKELEDLLHRSQGLLNVQKSDFIRLFWAAYTSSFTVDNILSSFPATGVHPREPDVVLKRFKTPPPPPQRDTNSDFGEEIDSNSWRQVVGLFDAAVPDKSKVEAKQLKQLLHNYQIHNQLYRREIDELRNEITTVRR
ncbi:hypothetical protein P3342_007359 [Pyrenophora teres f. teres]|nr:hypothetical protein P3342_007359 [Pyrenophora teres f. teres]